MSKKREAPTTDPILYEAPTVVIGDQTYTLRRLGLQDVFRVSRILGRGVSVLTNAGDLSPGQVVQVLIASLSANEDDVLALIADIIGVKRSELSDSERFPLVAFVDILEALSTHQDLRDFLSRVQTLTERLPEMQTASAKRSSS